LLRALRLAGPTERKAALNEATLWLRGHHPEAARLWSGWQVRDGELVSEPAPKLQ
jgi:hypothetical protein